MNIMTNKNETETSKEIGDNMKKDYGKDPWHLFPFDAARGIVKVLAFGAQKYAARGWEAGMDWSRVYSALNRHIHAWWNREGTDPDTGYSHLWHAGCCIMFLIAYELRGVGKDDRPYIPDQMEEDLKTLPKTGEVITFENCLRVTRFIDKYGEENLPHYIRREMGNFLDA